MKIQVQSIHFDADQKLIEYVQKKCNKLDTFYDRITDGLVNLKIDKDDANGNKIVEIILNVPGQRLIASERGHFFEEATDIVFDNLKRQVLKYKEKQSA